MANIKWYGENLKTTVRNHAKEHVMKMGFWVEGEAKKNLTILLAVDTGTLRSSIHTKYNPAEIAAYVGTNKERMSQTAGSKLSKYKAGGRSTKRKKKLTRITSGTAVFYAPYVEFGTYKMRARPYLRPALDALRAKRGVK